MMATGAGEGHGALGSVSESVAWGTGDRNEMRCKGERERVFRRCWRCKPLFNSAREATQERRGPLCCSLWRFFFFLMIDWLQVMLLGISSLEFEHMSTQNLTGFYNLNGSLESLGKDSS